MKKSLLLLLVVLIGLSASSQSLFKPKPLPTLNPKVGVSTAVTQNFWRPIADVTATILPDGSQLAGGVGLSFQHDTFDAASQQWVTGYSVSGIAFLNTNASFIGGLLLGIGNGIVQIGPGWNFTTGKFCILTGVGIKL